MSFSFLERKSTFICKVSSRYLN